MLLAGEKPLLEMTCIGQPLPEVLEDLCRLAEEIASDCLCSVSLVDSLALPPPIAILSPGPSAAEALRNRVVHRVSRMIQMDCVC